LFINRFEEKVRSSSSVLGALRKEGTNSDSRKWLDNLVAIETVATDVSEDSIESLFITKSKRTVQGTSPIQLAAGVLQGAKHYLARGYYLLKVLFGDDLRALYSDTDSFHVALSKPGLAECEDESLGDADLRKARRLLFGYPDRETAYSVNPDAKHSGPAGKKPLSGTLRVERDDVAYCIYPGLKCYELGGAEGGGGREVKAKSVVAKEKLSTEGLRGIVEASGFVKERRTELRPTTSGMEVMETVKTLGLSRSAVQYKFETRPGGDVRAFR